MRTTDEKVATPKKRGTSVYLSDDDRDDIKRLGELKYHGIPGITTILRLEGMKAVRDEIARIEEEQTEDVREAA